MKYISLVILLALLIWTWNMTTAERAFSLEQHKQVEAGVEADVRELIVRKFPSVTDIYCQQLYTELVKPGEELMAHFRCRAEGTAGKDERVEQVFEGHVLLKSNDQFKTWEATGGEITSPAMYFQNGVKISTKDPMPGDAAAATASEEQTQAPHAEEAPAVPAAPAHGEH